MTCQSNYACRGAKFTIRSASSYVKDAEFDKPLSQISYYRYFDISLWHCAPDSRCKVSKRISTYSQDVQSMKAFYCFTIKHQWQSYYRDNVISCSNFPGLISLPPATVCTVPYQEQESQLIEITA